MEKVLINNNVLTYRENDYEILSHEIIDNKFVHINIEGMTIALLPNNIEINGILVTKIEEIINSINTKEANNINNFKNK